MLKIFMSCMYNMICIVIGPRLAPVQVILKWFGTLMGPPFGWPITMIRLALVQVAWLS